MQNEIQQTTDYKKFLTLKGNRPLKPIAVQKLKISIKEQNLLSTNPIIVTKDFRIIDGQHRLEAAKELELPIYYLISENATIETVQLLNTNMERWSLTNYVESYVVRGNPHYKKLLEFVYSERLPITISATLLQGKKTRSGAGGMGPNASKTPMQDIVRLGRFEVLAEEYAFQISKYLKQMIPYIELNLERDRNFINALQNILDQVSFEEVFKQLERRNEKIPRRGNVREYMRELEIASNYGKSKNFTRFV